MFSECSWVDVTCSVSCVKCTTQKEMATGNEGPVTELKLRTMWSFSHVSHRSQSRSFSSSFFYEFTRGRVWPSILPQKQTSPFNELRTALAGSTNESLSSISAEGLLLQSTWRRDIKEKYNFDVSSWGHFPNTTSWTVVLSVKPRVDLLFTLH